MSDARRSRRQTPLGQLAKRFAAEASIPFTAALHAVDCAVAAGAVLGEPVGHDDIEAALVILRRRRAIAALPLSRYGDDWFDSPWPVDGPIRERTGPDGEEMWLDRNGREVLPPPPPPERATNGDGFYVHPWGDIDYRAYYAGENPYDALDEGFGTCDHCAGRILYHTNYNYWNHPTWEDQTASGWYHIDGRYGTTDQRPCLNGAGAAHPRRLVDGTCRICGDALAGLYEDGRCGSCWRLEESVDDAHDLANRPATLTEYPV
jgi:hypothetical protein